jgi:hypothetical protein
VALSPADTSSTSFVAASRAEIAREIQSELRPTAEALVAEVIGRVPAYSSPAGDRTRELMAINTWVVERILNAWVSGEFLSTDDQHRIDEIAAKRAVEGRPMPTVLRACHVGADKLIDIVVARGRGRLSADDVHALTRLGMGVMDYFDQAVYKSYAATSRRRGSREQALDDLLRDLLSGRQVSSDALADRCRELEVDLPATPVVLAVQSGTPAVTVHGLELRELLDESAGVPAEPVPLCGNVNQAAVAVMATLDHVAVGQALVDRGWRACAVERYALQHVSHAYELAACALRRAPDTAFGTRAILRDGDAEVLALLCAAPMASPLAATHAVLRDLDQGKDHHLIQTLVAYLHTGDAVAAAESLHMHPQTLRYRLKRVVALTQLDPRQPWDRYLLQTAVLAAAPAP